MRAISINEYLTTFGYHSQFALAIQKNHNCINMIRQMIPVKTMSSILSSAHIVLTDILKQTLASRYKSPSNPEETQVSQSSASIEVSSSIPYLIRRNGCERTHQILILVKSLKFLTTLNCIKSPRYDNFITSTDNR